MDVYLIVLYQLHHILNIVEGKIQKYFKVITQYKNIKVLPN